MGGDVYDKWVVVEVGELQAYKHDPYDVSMSQDETLALVSH